MLGEMASMVLEGNWVSAEKIMAAGYRFQFPDLDSALQDLFPQKDIK
jgi:NAD dependent epimerase/dehydratase family enzyme